MSQVVMIMLQDGLQQPSGAVAKAPYYHLIYCRVPDNWIEGEIPESDDLWLKGPVLFADKQESLLDALYGAGWRGGNSDGSQYVVIGSGTRLLNPGIESARPWLSDNIGDRSIRFSHYVGTAEGNFRRVLPSGL